MKEMHLTVWPTPDEELELARVMLKPLVDRSRGRISMELLERSFLSGEAQLWFVTEDGVTSSAAVTRIINYPDGRRVFRIDGAAGLLQDGQEFIGTLERIAQRQGCTSVRIEGREGWQRSLEGYSEVARILEKEIQNG
jgi:hypothetical protein